MAGGLTKGPSHAKGGIKMKVKSTGQQIEVEGGEGIINKHVMSSKKKISYKGKKATPCEIASDLNQITGNGVKFDCAETEFTDMTPTDPSTGFAKGGKSSEYIEVKPLKYIYHTSPIVFRENIEKDGLKPYKGEQWLSGTKIGSKAIFFSNSENKRDWFDSEYNDDVYRIDTTKLNNKFYQDPNFKSNKYIFTFDAIKPKHIKLLHKGDGKVKVGGSNEYFSKGGKMDELLELESEIISSCGRYECDGSTRVISDILNEKGIDHNVKVGTIAYGDKLFSPHFWIEVPIEDEVIIIDYKSKMWMGDEAKQGIFVLPIENENYVDGELVPQSDTWRRSGKMLRMFEKGGKVDSRYSYDIEYVDSEGDEYSEGFDSLEDAKKEIKYLKENGYRITRKFRYLDDKYVGSFAKGGRTNDKVSDKIRLLKDEGYPQDQAVAIALSMRDSGKLARGGVITFELRNNDGRYQEVWELDEVEMEDYGYTNLKEVSNKKLIEDYFGNVYFYDEDNVWVDEDVIVENIRREEIFAKGGKIAYMTYYNEWRILGDDGRLEFVKNILKSPISDADGNKIEYDNLYTTGDLVPNYLSIEKGSDIFLNAKVFGFPYTDGQTPKVPEYFPAITLTKDMLYSIIPRPTLKEGISVFPAYASRSYFFPKGYYKKRDYEGVGTRRYIELAVRTALGLKSNDPIPDGIKEVFIPASPKWEFQNFNETFTAVKKVAGSKPIYLKPEPGQKTATLIGHYNYDDEAMHTWYTKSIEYFLDKIASPLITFKDADKDFVCIDSFTGCHSGLPTYHIISGSYATKLKTLKQRIYQGIFSTIMIRLCQEVDIRDYFEGLLSIASPKDKKDEVLSWFHENYWPDASPTAVYPDGKTQEDFGGPLDKYMSPVTLQESHNVMWYGGQWKLFQVLYNLSMTDWDDYDNIKEALEDANIDDDQLNMKPVLNTRFYIGFNANEINSEYDKDDFVIQISKEKYLELNKLIDNRLRDTDFLKRCVDFYNDRTLESINETNLSGFLSPSFILDTTKPIEITKLSKEEKNINLFKTHPNKKEIKRIQTLMSILDFDYQAKKQLNEEIRILEDDLEVELNLDGKPHYNLKNAFKNFFKTADKKYVGKIGKQTEALAPDGERSTLTTKQYDLVRTRQFMTWFGDWQEAFETKNYEGVSKCISEDGEPKIVYHGTVSPFEWTKFSLGEDSSWTKDAPPVVYFAETKEYSEWFGSSKKTGKAGDDYVYEFFLNCRNPINLIDFGYSDLNIFDLEFLLKEKHGIEIDTTEIVARVPNIQAVKYPFWVFLRNYKRFGLGNMFDKFIALGYDSIQFVENNPSNIIDGKSDVTVAWVIFDKNQAKLGDGRNTTFSQFSDDFRFKKGGNVNR